MEKLESQSPKYDKVGCYKGNKIYVGDFVPREWVARICNKIILIHPEAYEILKERPDFLERIYEHEIELGDTHDPHDCLDKDILSYLKMHGYDFGEFDFEEKN